MIEIVNDIKKLSDKLDMMTKKLLNFELSESEIKKMDEIAQKKFQLYDQFIHMSKSADIKELKESVEYGIKLGVL